MSSMVLERRAAQTREFDGQTSTFALNGHAVMSDMGPLSGAKRTFGQTVAVSAEFIADGLSGDERA
jgi:hypothetical protein